MQNAHLGLSCDQARPLKFRGRLVKHIPIFRFALRTLGQLIWSSDDDSWGSLDPIVTLHPDALIFEAFSSDLASYGCLRVCTDLFESEGDVEYGTTNIDFSGWLWAALGELRRSRQTTLTLGNAGVSLDTATAGGRFEPKVEVPEEWFRAFLEVQAAMAQGGSVRLDLAPVDLLAPIRFLRYTRARTSPRAMRYELNQGQWQIVLEPWEKAFPLRHPAFGPDPRRVRTWGRQRLRLIESLLPFARRVRVELHGRARPHFYCLELPGMHFTLGLTGWGRQQFQEDCGYSLLHGQLQSPVDEAALEARRTELADLLQAPAHPLDPELVRRGLAMFDLVDQVYRYRPLTARALDLKRLYPQDLRQEQAATLKPEGVSCQAEESRKLKRFKTPEGSQQREVIYRNWKIQGACQGHELELVVNDQEQILFGRCGCDFFQKHLLQRGPCAHLLALYRVSREQRLDLAVSQIVEGEPSDHDE